MVVFDLFFFCVFLQGAENLRGFGESQKARVLPIEFITLYPVVTELSFLGLCEGAERQIMCI